MAFYESIAEVYDYIFPLNPVQLEFIGESLKYDKEARLLDVGCGTGNLALALSGIYNEVTGIDTDKAMLELARAKAGQGHKNLRFETLGMLQIAENLNTVDAILCLGNTLVHLTSEQEVLEFLLQSRKILVPGGKLLIQIINYDRIIDQDIRDLPAIENEILRFERKYHYDAIKNIIGFDTQLLIKANNRTISNLIYLIPMRKAPFESLLLRAGFSRLSFYGNFKREPLSSTSIPLVVEAC